MIVYTSCRSCGGLLHTTDGDVVHPLCDPKPTKVERLSYEWLQAVKVREDELAARLEAEMEAIDMQPPRLLDAALKYASYGWPVFPLAPIGYTTPRYPDYVGTGKKPYPGSRGFKDATTDPERIKAWWTRYPTCNIGLPTGIRFDVIDFDIPDGIPTLHKLIGEDCVVHGWVTTAHAGTHLYMQPTGRGNAARWMPGTDYRGIGGYVVAPPSWLGKRGTSWTWRHHPSPVLTGVGDTYEVQL